jgi:hypothetical protein
MPNNSTEKTAKRWSSSWLQGRPLAGSILGAAWIYLLRPPDGVNVGVFGGGLFVLWMYVFTLLLALLGGSWLVHKQERNWDGRIAPFVWIVGVAVTFAIVDYRRGLAISGMMLAGLPVFALIYRFAGRRLRAPQ